MGGRLTTQITQADEHGPIERFGCTASYRRFRDAVRHYYRTHTPLTEAARRDPRLNPGNGWVSPLCHEPRVARTVLESLLEPHVAAGRLHYAACARGGRPRPGDTVTAVTLRDVEEGGPRTVRARFFLDATELGNLLAPPHSNP